MTDEKQYFDSWKVENDALWVIDKEQGIEAPLDEPNISVTHPSKASPGEIVLRQKSGGWWYSRTKHATEAAFDSEHKRLSAAIDALNLRPRR